MLLLLSRRAGGRGRDWWKREEKVLQKMLKKYQEERIFRVISTCKIESSRSNSCSQFQTRLLAQRGGGHMITADLTVLQKHENNKRKVLNLRGGGMENSLVIYAKRLSRLSLSSAV